MTASKTQLHLFEPVSIGGLELKNRIVFPAITTLFDTHYDFKGQNRSLDFYAEIARGGAGLVTIGALQATYPGRREDRVAINQDKYLPRLETWVDAVHQFDARAAAQLSVWNYWAPGGPGTPAENVSPSGIVTVPDGGYPQGFDLEKMGVITRPLKIVEIIRMEHEIADAAARAVRAGFDAIEIPAVSGNLFSRFITPHTNQREDEYGGSLENRLRFLLETIALVRKQAAGLPVIVRIPGSDLMPWGITLEDSLEIAPHLERVGVSALSVMPGWYETRQPRHQLYAERGAFVHLAAAIKKTVNIPVCTNMRINTPELAESIIAEGQADLVALGRPLMADPEFPNKCRESRTGEIRHCVACCVCYEEIAVDKPCRCSVNPAFGMATEPEIRPAARPKHVLVAGAGPAGLEVSRIATLRGHRVTLYEQTDDIGGQLRFAVLPPHKEEWQTLTEYYRHEMTRLGVDIRLKSTLTAEAVAREKADVLVVATGAVPIIPGIPGLDLPHCATALDVLADRREVKGPAVIIGGGLIGCETADFITRNGTPVTILEMLADIGVDIGPHNRWLMLQRLNQAGVRMLPATTAREVTESGVLVENGDGQQLVPAASVVIAAGMTCADGLTDAITSGVPEHYLIGDCVTPNRVRYAVEQGFLLGLRL
jgi:2,4-dienoyl-CoA reductase (NADPH2)